MIKMNWDEIKYSLKNLWFRKTRTFLTMLSILIGIASIFAIMSFGFGLQNYMDSLATESGTDKLYIQAASMGAPGTDDTFVLSTDDVDFVSKINGVKEITPFYMKPAEITSGKESKFAYLTGIETDKSDVIEETFTVDIIKGRRLKDNDLNKVVLGYRYMFDNKFFKKGLELGDKVEINNTKFEIVGFYDEVGNTQDDSNIYLSFRGYENIYPDDKDEFGWVLVQSQPDIKPKDLADKIEEKLRKHKGQEEGKEDFFVQTFEDAIAMFSTIINILNGILGAIAAISIVVAFVNIMNTMYTAVLERTKEIGIMKAIGARNSEILSIFVFEASFVGMIGGALGVFIGFLISSAGGAAAANGGFAMLKPVFPLSLIIVCIISATLVGGIAGVLPAVQASKQKPVDSLRYE